MERPFLRDVAFYIAAGFWAYCIFHKYVHNELLNELFIPSSPANSNVEVKVFLFLVRLRLSENKGKQELRMQTKGQLISKCIFGVFQFFQKTNENKSAYLSNHSS